MKLTPTALTDVGRALYGPTWQKALSDALSVSDRTMRRWTAGTYTIPETIGGDIAKLCRKRSVALAVWAHKLSEP